MVEMKISIERLENKVEEISQKQFKKARRWKMEKNDKKSRRPTQKYQYLNNKNSRKRAERKSKEENHQKFSRKCPSSKLHEFSD